MAGKLGKFQIQEFEGWKGTTRENHLGALGLKSPQKLNNFIVQLLGFHRGKTIDTFLSQFPVREFDSDDEYYWEVIGSARKNIPLLEARDENQNVVTKDSGMVGANTAPFYLVFAEDYFADGEYVVGNLNEIYQFRILGDPRFEGTNVVYKVELAGANYMGCPAERLLAGERFSIEAAFVEKEGSRKVGDIRFSAPVTMRNEWTRIRKYHKVFGSMLNKKLAVGLPVTKPTNNGYQRTVEDKWMHYVDWVFEQEFSDEKNKAMLFGRSNRTKNGEYMNIGKSGSTIQTGMGLYEQMEAGNVQYYNTFSLKLIEEALFSLSTTKLGFKDRLFVLRTGERGASQFHKAVLNTVSGWTAFTYNGDALKIIEKTNSNLHSNALSAGFQFVEFKGPNGVRLKVEVDPYYDDPVRNKIQHPNGGPAFSYRYDIMEIGTPEQANIFKCKIKGQDEVKGYQWGLRNPFTGQMNNPHMSFDEDSAAIHKMAVFGVCVLDPTRTMSIIPAILQG